jgi:hypothetical protein
MTDAPDSAARLFSTRWVHLYEEDTPAGEVYVPEEGPVPLSRRPRERLELNADGTATLSRGGADDRPAAHAARWTRDGQDIVIRAAAGGQPLRIVEASPARLLVRRSS